MSNFNPSELQNLSDLLLSSDEMNTTLAFEIIGGNNVGMELVSELFAIYKMSNEFKNKNKAADLLKKLNSEEINEAMDRKSYLDGYASRNKIKDYCKGTPLDPMKLALALYNKYGKGLQYLVSELDSPALSTLLKSFIQGQNAFVLEGKQITKIPKELLQFTALEKLVLTDNQIKTLPKGISNLSKLKALHLHQNKIKKLPKSINKLKELEFLDISRNDLQEIPATIVECTKLKHLNLGSSGFGEQFPTVIFDIPNLETLDLSWVTGGYSIDMPEGFSKLKKLTSLIFSDSSTTSFFPNFPRFTSLTGTAEHPIDTNTLALAKRAYEQNKEAIEYLFKHAESDYITSMLKDLMDGDKLVFDVAVLLDRLPKETKDCGIKELHLTYRYSTLNTGFWDSLEHLSDLEVLVLGDDIGPTSSWENVMSEQVTRLTKLRILDTNQFGFTKIPASIGNLTNLEELNLSLNVEETEIPESIKELKKLKKLHIGIRMMPSMSDKEEAKILSDRAAKYQKIFPNCAVTCSR